jgi:dTDP-4-amino-4,6-dideoxygalactose transaminase
MKLMSLNGQTKDAFSKNMAGDWKYDIKLDGYKMNMPDICATIGLVQIRKYKDFLLPSRKRIANRFNDAFKNKSWAILPTLSKGDTESSYHIYPLRIKDITEKERDKIIELISKREVAVNVHFIPLPMLSFFKEIGYRIEDYPLSYKNYSCEISLPIYPQLKENDVDLIISSVVESYSQVKTDG